MAILPNDPPQPLTAQDVDAWLLAAQERRAKLHLDAAGPWTSTQRQEAFAAMSVLLMETFEEIRVVSAQLREENRAILAKATDLQERSAKLIERGTRVRERTA